MFAAKNEPRPPEKAGESESRMNLKRVVGWLDHELKLSEFASDYSNNGLQVEASAEVTRAVFGVDGCAALIDAAAERKADFIFVHHGLSWGGEPRRLTGITAQRYGELLRRGISLYAAHLPLDAAVGFGNNARLAAMVKLLDTEPFFVCCGAPIGRIGVTGAARRIGEIRECLERELPCRSVLLGEDDREVQRIAVVSGGGGLEAVEKAAEANADLLITGELEHVMFHYAVENGLAVLALGHYASETTGPKAIMERFSSELGIPAEFVDIPTGL